MPVDKKLLAPDKSLKVICQKPTDKIFWCPDIRSLNPGISLSNQSLEKL
jgi:hypothetical protein